MIADILRFYRDARERLDAGVASTATLGDYLDDCGSGRASAITSSSRSRPRSGRPASDRILDFPIDYLLRFLDHHGLIGVGRALQWRTITGRLDGLRGPRSSSGSAATRSAPGDPVVAVDRTADEVTVRTAAGTSRHVRCGRHGDPRGRCAGRAPGRGPARADARSAGSTTR